MALGRIVPLGKVGKGVNVGGAREGTSVCVAVAVGRGVDVDVFVTVAEDVVVSVIVGIFVGLELAFGIKVAVAGVGLRYVAIKELTAANVIFTAIWSATMP